MKFLLEFVAVLRSIFRLGPWQAFKLLCLAPRSSKRFSIRTHGLCLPVIVRGKSSDSFVFNQVLVCNEYAGFVKDPPNTILDGGANIGLVSLYWSSTFPEAKIVAVEPDRENFEVLVNNTGHLSNVTCLQGALWSKNTKVRFQNDKDVKYALKVVEDEANGTIKAYNIPSIMELMGWDRIDVVKLDVEGAEVHILAENSKEWIDKINVLIVGWHQNVDPNTARVLFKAFSEQDFSLRWRGQHLILTRYAG